MRLFCASAVAPFCVGKKVVLGDDDEEEETTYHGPLLVGQEDPDDGLVRGPRVGPRGVAGGLQHRQTVGGPRGGQRGQRGQRGGDRGGGAKAARGLQQLLLPLLEGVQLAGVLLVRLQGAAAPQQY